MKKGLCGAHVGGPSAVLTQAFCRCHGDTLGICAAELGCRCGKKNDCKLKSVGPQTILDWYHCTAELRSVCLDLYALEAETVQMDQIADCCYCLLLQGQLLWGKHPLPTLFA